jgi:hypothetical protein
MAVFHNQLHGAHPTRRFGIHIHDTPDVFRFDVSERGHTKSYQGGLKYAVLHSSPMTDEHANTDSAINEAVRILKLKIPPEDHAALDSRLQELINDPSTDDDDVISILLDEFDPA